MILKEYDIGWGMQWPMKKLEQDILKTMLANYRTDDSRTVIINSVWYTGDYHQKVMEELRNLKPTHIFVIAMLDPPNIDLRWFDELDCVVQGIGYYPGPGYIDYCALFVNHFYKPVEQELLLDTSRVDTAYMCLNRKPHQHRMRLYMGLEEAGILDSGFVSMGGDPVPLRLLAEDSQGQEIAPNGGKDQFGITNDIVSLGNMNNWQRHFVNVITETIWDIQPSDFISEKTFKPILGLRPFLIYAPNGGVDCLTSRGFESYVNDFRDIVEMDLTQPYHIVEFLKILVDQGPNYWKMKLASLQGKLLHNRDVFFKHVQQQAKKM